MKEEIKIKKVDYYATDSNHVVIKFGGNSNEFKPDIIINCPCDACLLLFLGGLSMLQQRAHFIFQQIKEKMKNEGNFKEKKDDSPDKSNEM